MKKRGYESKIVIPPAHRIGISRNQARREYLKIILLLSKNDVVFLQNSIFSTYFIVLICLVKLIFRPTLILDFDDATWVQNPIAPRIVAFFSDKFIVASHYLTSWAPLQGKPIMVMANLVDYSLAERYGVNKERKTVVLGWIGNGPLSLQNMEILVPVFKELVKRGIRFTFKLVGTLSDRYPHKSKELINLFTISGVETVFVDSLEWGKDGEIQKANSSFDVGLCPLLDSVSNRARCSLKVLDYMAAGIPVVISPVGEHLYFVDEGENGFLPKTVLEWVDALEKLITDNRLRKLMGRASLEKLKKEFSYQANIEKYIDFLGL